MVVGPKDVLTLEENEIKYRDRAIGLIDAYLKQNFIQPFTDVPFHELSSLGSCRRAVLGDIIGHYDFVEEPKWQKIEIIDYKNGLPVLRFHYTWTKDPEYIKRDLAETSVYDMGLSIRALNALRQYEPNIETARQLAAHTGKQLLSRRNVGKRTLQEYKDSLKRIGLKLGEKIPE